MTLPLVLYLLFVVVTFGWKAWVQYRRTGDHGFRGFSGAQSPAERWSGAAFAIALLLLPAAAIMQAIGLTEAVATAGWIEAAGLVLMIAGFGLVLVAQTVMGAGWRVGIDPSERLDLIETGPFAVVRNPVFSAIALFALGFAFLVPTVLTMTGLLIGGAAIELQVRFVEEPYLKGLHGDAYMRYARRVGRFVPGVGRLGEGHER